MASIKRMAFDNVAAFCLENDNGLRVELCSLGASVLRVYAPDRNGRLENIALTLSSAAAMRESGIYAGVTVGPAAGRLSGGVLPVLDHVYQLTQNDNGNTLHSGPDNLSGILWRAQDVQCDEQGARVTFCTELEDGQGGFPGARRVAASYTLTRQNALSITYTATSDKSTYLNLTNHSYWNLSGDFSRAADRHILQISADKVYYNDPVHIPIELAGVAGTPFDFRTPIRMADAMRKEPSHPQLQNARGYDNAFLLSGSPGAMLADEASGRRLTLCTDYPCMVLYSGGFLDQHTKTADGQILTSRSAIALEAQYVPDAPRLMGKMTPVLMPGEVYTKTISFRFDTV